MHEGSLTEDLFSHVLIHAREAHARRITHVKVTIGALSDATAESIQFYWESLAPGTIAEQADLEFDLLLVPPPAIPVVKNSRSSTPTPPAPNAALSRSRLPAGTVSISPVWKSKQMTTSMNISMNDLSQRACI